MYSACVVELFENKKDTAMEIMTPSSTMITRSVTVDRTIPLHTALAATGRVLYVVKSILTSMPRGTDQKVEMFFFKRDRQISHDDLQKEYDICGLMPDPIAQAKVNEDPTFADTYPNATHWKDAKGKWCFAAFDRTTDPSIPCLVVDRSDEDWSGIWWFGGVLKQNVLKV